MSTDQNPYSSPQADFGAIAPESYLGSGELADRLPRFLAAFIDGLILMVPMIVIGILLGVVLAVLGIADGILGGLIMTVASLAGVVACFVLINGKLLSEQGQTWGKKIMEIRIVNDDGSRANFQDILLKRYLPVWVAGMIPIIGGVITLVDSLLIFRENRKCLHDDIAGTKVIKA